MTDPIQRFARVALRAERDSAATMRALLTDLDRELRVLKGRRNLDKTGQAQIARILRKQSTAWNDLARIIERDRQAALQAANLVANDLDKRFLDRLPMTAKQRREWSQSQPFNRNETAETARRVSRSNKVARDLLNKRINEQTSDLKKTEKTIRSQIQPRQTGGVSYVAKRLVRTEMATAFHDAQIARAERTPWVTGLRWTLSPTHKGPDICDKLANRVFAPRAQSVPPIPHPNCMCTLTPIMMNEKQFKAALSEGIFDMLVGRELTTAERKQL